MSDSNWRIRTHYYMSFCSFLADSVSDNFLLRHSWPTELMQAFYFVLGTGIEPILQEWKSWVLTVIRTEHYKTDTSCSFLSTVNDSIPEMIRTESIKRTDHLFTFLFSKIYLDKLTHIDSHNYYRDKIIITIDNMSSCQDVIQFNTSTHNTCFHIVYPSLFNSTRIV